MKVKILGLFAAGAFCLYLCLGCATGIGIVEDVCDVALGGSKVGDSLCDNIDKIKSQ